MSKTKAAKNRSARQSTREAQEMRERRRELQRLERDAIAVRHTVRRLSRLIDRNDQALLSLADKIETRLRDLFAQRDNQPLPPRGESELAGAAR